MSWLPINQCDYHRRVLVLYERTIALAYTCRMDGSGCKTDLNQKILDIAIGNRRRVDGKFSIGFDAQGNKQYVDGIGWQRLPDTKGSSL